MNNIKVFQITDFDSDPLGTIIIMDHDGCGTVHLNSISNHAYDEMLGGLYTGSDQMLDAICKKMFMLGYQCEILAMDYIEVGLDEDSHYVNDEDIDDDGEGFYDSVDLE